MRFFKKFAGLFVAAMLLLPSLGQAYTTNGNLDVRGNIIGGDPTLASTNLSLALSGGTPDAHSAAFDRQPAHDDEFGGEDSEGV